MKRSPPSGASTTDAAVPGIVAAPDVEAAPAVVADRYRLVGRLGRGGGGAVWRAYDEKVGEEVALKIVSAGGDAERWRREVSLARRVSHPNVCRVYDLGEAEGLRFVTMELITGQSLRKAIAGRPLERAEPILRQLISGVEAIHRAGVVHRDLKPENIVIDRDGRPVIVDFGLAREPQLERAGAVGAAPRSGHSRVTHDGVVVGTPSYMAPEQALGLPVDQRTDVYALGLVLHEALTGSLPGERTTASLKAGARPVPPPPLAPPPWSAIISRCLEVDPDHRFADATALVAALAPVSRQRRRWLIAAALVSLLGVLAAVTAVLAANPGGEEPLTLRLVALEERRLTRSAASSQPLSALVSPDGQRFAYTVADEVFVGDVAGGEPSRFLAHKTYKPSRSLAWVVGFFPDRSLAILVRKRRDNWSAWRVGERPPELLFESSGRFGATLSPDGSRLAVAIPSVGISVVATSGDRRPRPTARAAPGEMIGGLAWSPAGDQIAFIRNPAEPGELPSLEVTSADGAASRVLIRRPLLNIFDQLLVWPGEDRLLYAINDADGATLAVLPIVGDAAGDEIEVARWPDTYVSIGGYSRGRLVVSRGLPQPRYAIYTSKLYSRGSFGVLTPLHADSLSGRRLAGWSPGGEVVFSSTGAGGRQEIIAMAPGGAGELIASTDDVNLFADTLAGPGVIYQRPAGAEVELWRYDLESLEDRRLAAVPAATASSNVVRCAGDRAPPCLIERVSGGDIQYNLLDPVSGAIGREIYRRRLVSHHQMRNFAVTADGSAMALVDGSDRITTVELDDGEVFERTVAPGVELQSVSWANDGKSVLVSAIGYDSRLFSLLRVRDDNTTSEILRSNHQWMWRAQESPDGERVAVQTRDLVLDLWLVEGL